MLLFVMTLKPNALALSLLIPVIVSAILAIEAWRPRYAPRGKVFALLMFAIGLWSAAYALELASVSREAMLFWLKVEYLAIPYISVLMLLVILQFSGLNTFISSRHIGFLLIIPVLTMFLSITHEYHSLYYKDVTVNTSGNFPLLQLSLGPWYYVHVIYSYVIILYSVAVLSKKLYYQRSLFRNQLIFMLIAVIIPLATFTVYFAGLMPVKNIDPTPFAFAASGLAMSVSILKFRMLDLMPIAREHVFRSMGDGLVILDKKSRLVDCNPMTINVFGWNKIPYGSSSDQLWHNYPKVIELLSVSGSEIREFSTVINGKEHVYLGSASDIKNHKKDVVGKLIVIHDITQRHVLQETIRKSEEKLRLLNAEKDKLFSIIAHDLRGPIGAFSKLTEMFLTENDLTAGEMKTIATDMNHSAQSLQGLLENLLQWSRMQRDDVTIKKQYLYVKPLVDKSLDLLREPVLSKTLFIKNMVPVNLMVYADENMLQTVLRNLLSNAIKFTPKGGNIIIQSKETDGNANIRVRDTGIGMPAEMIAQLYNFEQKTGRQGTEGEPSTGLGLILCKDFIEKNGGILEVESEEGKGSTFSFTVPLHNAVVVS
ncbi:MAG: integral membrane sensor signal transduction histidine kinase [Bacteroidetes bacterium]|nr:MAG: integral membrane sensor signal transduction histidine kinase [Bacteroidota bacterium]